MRILSDESLALIGIGRTRQSRLKVFNPSITVTIFTSKQNEYKYLKYLLKYGCKFECGSHYLYLFTSLLLSVFVNYIICGESQINFFIFIFLTFLSCVAVQNPHVGQLCALGIRIKPHDFYFNSHVGTVGPSRSHEVSGTRSTRSKRNPSPFIMRAAYAGQYRGPSRPIIENQNLILRPTLFFVYLVLVIYAYLSLTSLKINLQSPKIF